MTTMVSTIGHGTWYAPGPHSHIYDDSIAFWVTGLPTITHMFVVCDVLSSIRSDTVSISHALRGQKP